MRRTDKAGKSPLPMLFKIFMTNLPHLGGASYASGCRFRFNVNRWALFSTTRRSLPAQKGSRALISSAPNPLERLASLYAQGANDSVITAAQQMIAEGLDSADLRNILGLSYARKGTFSSAASAFEAVVDIAPDFLDANFNLALAHRQLGNLSAAVQSYRSAIASDPKRAETHHNLAATLVELGELNEAIRCFQSALQCDPRFTRAWAGLGRALARANQHDPAIAAFIRAVELCPSDADRYLDLGTLLKAEGEFDQAAGCFNHALGLRPNDTVACNGLANVLRLQGKADQAIETYHRALSIDPDQIETLVNLATLLKEQGNVQAAIPYFTRALDHAPNDLGARLHRYECTAALADWSHVAEGPSLAQRSLGGKSALPPFPLLSIEDNPANQLQRSKRWASEMFRQPHPRPHYARAKRPDRLRIGYFSADVRNHPVMHLIAGLFRQHDRSRFDVSIYSYGPPIDDDMTARVSQSVEEFHDLRGQSDKAIVAKVQQHELDVAVDLTGYTAHSRSGLFAYRLAPIQISYLGYPGGTGAPFIDYIIADPVVIPEPSFAHYSEKVIHLPHSYQANDNQRSIAATHTQRADFGLPQAAFVFCCFNATYKITPCEFDIWMRCLDQVDGSVLWLLAKKDQTVVNLRNEARKRGIAPARLIFAKPLPNDEHLARHKHADLFLDTFKVNAHTTASDALWAGLPVLTRIGEQFCARVGASLLTAVGLTELITSTDTEYEAIAVELARSPKRVARLSARLVVNRECHPLFDTTTHCRAIEAAYDKAYKRLLDGKAPDHFRA